MERLRYRRGKKRIKSTYLNPLTYAGEPMTSKSFTLSESENANVWLNLQRAICGSTGFQRWKSELPSEILDQTPLEQLVRRYLRETLETLAY